MLAPSLNGDVNQSMQSRTALHMPKKYDFRTNCDHHKFKAIRENEQRISPFQPDISKTNKSNNSSVTRNENEVPRWQRLYNAQFER